MRRTLSQNIKAGIRRAKALGKEIGANGRRLAALNKMEALERAERLYPVVKEFRGADLSYREMVKVLNERGAPTPTGRGRWHVRTLQRLVDRASELHPPSNSTVTPPRENDSSVGSSPISNLPARRPSPGAYE